MTRDITNINGGNMAENYFINLYNIDVREKVKQKNSLNYLSWAAAWAEVKKVHPDASFTIYEEILTMSDTGIPMKTRPWFDDGKTGWVKTGVTINGIEHIEELPIMDFKNKSMVADNITSADANKSIQRSLTKACARHGLGLYIYEGEDLPEESKQLERLRADCYKLVVAKSQLSEDIKTKVNELCKAADSKTNDPRQMTDIETLKLLKIKLNEIKSEEEANLKKIKSEIINRCNELGGTKNTTLMSLLKDYDKNGNPNSIKNIKTATELLNKLKKM